MDDAILNTTVAGRYEVYAKLGEGGMGAVYAARQAPLGRSIALKVLLKQLSDDPIAIKRFEKEALAISRLAHPNTVTIFDYGQTENGLMYIAMEYLEGNTLRQTIESEAPIEARRVVRILAQIARALSEAHLRGVIHRDLKPDNIMLVPTAGEPDFVKILDFGVAKLRTQQGMDVKTLTQGDVIFGTPRYMSPEQVGGNMNEPRSDLYALGAIAYEMLAGSAPFDGDSAMKILMAHLQQVPVPFANLVPAVMVPEPLEEVVMRLLAKEPDDRYEGADELLHALDALPQLGGGLRPPSGRTEGLPRAMLTPAASPKVGTQQMGSDFVSHTALSVATDETDPKVPLADAAQINGIGNAETMAMPGFDQKPTDPIAPAFGEMAEAGTHTASDTAKGARRESSDGEDTSLVVRESMRSTRSYQRYLFIALLVGVLVGLTVLFYPRDEAIDAEKGLTQPAPAPFVTLTIVSNPEHARIFVDDKELGFAPMTSSVSVGKSHKIRAVLGGYQSIEQERGFEKDTEITLMLAKERLDAAEADASPTGPTDTVGKPRVRAVAKPTHKRVDAAVPINAPKHDVEVPTMNKPDAQSTSPAKDPIIFERFGDWREGAIEE